MTIAVRDTAKPRILFYLPVVGVWWFNDIVVPMIRAAAKGGEVHVLVPPIFSQTGIRDVDLARCGPIDDVTWHILDGDDHPDLRLSGKVHQHVVDLVREIDPEICLCRSNDIDTPAQFPGVVRYIMEADSPPFQTPYWTVQFTEGLFDHGWMPSLSPAQEEWLEAAAALRWDQYQADYPKVDRATFLAENDLPSDKLLLAMPLEHEHEEIFWHQHSPFPTNAALIDAMADALDDDTMLLVTMHPIAAKQLSLEMLAITSLIRRRRDKVRLIGNAADMPRSATWLMLQHSEGMIFGNSKCFSIAAFLGKPMLRMSKFATGDWLNVHSSLPQFVERLRNGTARAPDAADAARWFAYHHANNMIAPVEAGLDAERLIDHALNVVNPSRWERGLDRFLRDKAHLLAPMPAPPTKLDTPPTRALSADLEQLA